MKLCPKTPNLVQLTQKFWALYMKTSVFYEQYRGNTVLHFMTTHSISVLLTVTWFNTTKRTHCCFHGNSGHTNMAQFYIICTCPVVFIVHIHAYHTPISVFCRYENLNCACSVMIWCSFLSCVVICFVGCSQMCLSTYILWTAAPVN